ncbi:nucleotide sugar dehydrogenase [Sulfitobacter pacificus]|uniref:nucleotide sugar dehydrogenase n=1 Tax=Sulfitobacter pacificus TaxID=1499314 RepID=UPI003618A053
MANKSFDIAVIGVGYVGLPLAVRLSAQHERVVGFDTSAERVAGLNGGHDVTGEIEDDELQASSCLFSNDPSDIASCNVYIVTVPTPVLDTKQPDLGPLHKACHTVGPLVNRGDLIIFESTVYPGMTEDICGPILAEQSGLTQGEDFQLGYSPERINPGDKVNRLETIVKNVSADSDDALERVVAVYEPAIDAGLFRCSSIMVAEAAKVMENTQRDINIALMNELSMICSHIGINTFDVIEAASTKWNFLPFTPGLVGGHCIGVDPYYLASLSERVGHHPEVILSGRRLNDEMPRSTVNTLIKLLALAGNGIRSARIGVFGISFKEDVPDLRNSKAIEIIDLLREFGCSPMIHDPLCDPKDAKHYGIDLVDQSEVTDLDLMIVVAPHKEYTQDDGFLGSVKQGGILADIRGVFRKTELPADVRYWCL